MKCRACHEPFTKQRPLQVICFNHDCAVRFAELQAEKKAKRQAKAEKIQTRERKAALRTRSDWLKIAQGVFNAYIRLRDAGKPCISCGRLHEGAWHAGHLYSVAARPWLRFDEANVHKQCAPCNLYLHGNLIEYRHRIVDRIGIDELERLDGPATTARQDVEALKAIKETYRAKAKQLEKP